MTLMSAECEEENVLAGWMVAPSGHRVSQRNRTWRMLEAFGSSKPFE